MTIPRSKRYGFMTFGSSKKKSPYQPPADVKQFIKKRNGSFSNTNLSLAQLIVDLKKTVNGAETSKPKETYLKKYPKVRKFALVSHKKKKNKKKVKYKQYTKKWAKVKKENIVLKTKMKTMEERIEALEVAESGRKNVKQNRKTVDSNITKLFDSIDQIIVENDGVEKNMTGNDFIDSPTLADDCDSPALTSDCDDSPSFNFKPQTSNEVETFSFNDSLDLQNFKKISTSFKHNLYDSENGANNNVEQIRAINQQYEQNLKQFIGKSEIKTENTLKLSDEKQNKEKETEKSLRPLFQMPIASKNLAWKQYFDSKK